MATIIFLLAIAHTFLATKFMHLAHRWRDEHAAKIRTESGTAHSVSFKAEIMHFFGEVEAIFGLWVIPLLVGMVTIYFLARYFMRQIAELQREIAAVRSEFETHLRTANADMVAALTKSTEVIAHNSAILEQIHRKLMG